MSYFINAKGRKISWKRLGSKAVQMEQRTLKNVNNCLNTKIYSYLETSGGQRPYLYNNVVHFFNTSVNLTYVAAYDSCFPSLVSHMCCSIRAFPRNLENYQQLWTSATLSDFIKSTTNLPPGKPYWRVRISTLGLLDLTSLDLLIFTLKKYFSVFTKQPILMRRSTVLSLPLQ